MESIECQNTRPTTFSDDTQPVRSRLEIQVSTVHSKLDWATLKWTAAQYRSKETSHELGQWQPPSVTSSVELSMRRAGNAAVQSQLSVTTQDGCRWDCVGGAGALSCADRNKALVGSSEVKET